MPDNHIHLPPMPKPQDFGITEETWLDYAQLLDVKSQRAAAAKIQAYYHALEVWKQVAGK